jgi:hypothetical protein
LGAAFDGRAGLLFDDARNWRIILASSPGTSVEIVEEEV